MVNKGRHVTQAQNSQARKLPTKKSWENPDKKVSLNSQGLPRSIFRIFSSDSRLSPDRRAWKRTRYFATSQHLDITKQSCDALAKGFTCLHAAPMTARTTGYEDSSCDSLLEVVAAHHRTRHSLRNQYGILRPPNR